jgi:putative flippase GtrA
VSSVRGLYERFRHLIHEGSKFLVIGAIATVITFGVANALNEIGRYKAVTIATILATAFSYVGNRYWTFRHRQGQGTTRDTVLFFVLNGIGLLIYYACIGLTDLAGQGKSKLWYNVALVVGTGLGTLFRFWSYRKWVWVTADTRVLERAEPPQELAQDLAAMVGAAPVTHHEQSPVPGAAGASQNGATPVSQNGTGPHRPPASHRAPASHRRTR